MKVISQDGTLDMPYEICTVWCRGSVIMCDMCGDNTTKTVLATYSTDKKAQKVMEMLRDAYVGMPIVMQNVDVSEDVVKQFEKLKNSGIIVQTMNNEPSKVEYVNNCIFQFPKDDEIEVET